MTRAYDPHHLPVEGRSWQPSWTQQQAMKAVKHEEHLENVQTLQSMGYSQVQIAKALGVDRKTIYRYVQEIRQNRLLENVQTLPERLDLSLQNKEFMYRQAMAIVTDKRVLNKDRVAALDVALKLDKSIDELKGTTAPGRVPEAAVAELYQAFLTVVGQVTGREYLFVQALQQQLKGTATGSLLLGALNNDALYVDEDPEPEVIQDEVETPAEASEHDVQITDEMLPAPEADEGVGE